MAEEWYYRVFGQEFGPIELGEMKELASSGLIAPDDKIRRGSTDWVAAKSMNTLRFTEPHDSAVEKRSPAIAPGAATTAIAPTAKPATASAAAQATTTLIQAQARYSAAEQSANLQVAWAHTVDPAWWASIAGVGYGPIGFATIFEWAATGRLSPTDLVKNGYYGQCIPAGNVPGLFMAVSTLTEAMVELTAAQAAAKCSAPALAPSTSAGACATTSPTADQPAEPAASRLVAASPAIATKSVSKVEPGPVQKSVPVRPAVADQSSTSSIATVSSSASMASVQAPSLSSQPYGHAAYAKSTPRIVRPKLGSRTSSDQSVFQLMKNPRWIGGSGIAALALIVLLFMGSRSSAKDIERFRDLKQILEEVRTARAAGSKDFASLKQRAKKMAEVYAGELKREANNRYPAKQALLFAVRDEMPRMISGDLSTTSQSEKNFELRLKDAAATLGID